MTIENEIQDLEREVIREIKHAEKWMIERRKFLIKLGMVIAFVLVLIVASELYLNVTGY